MEHPVAGFVFVQFEAEQDTLRILLVRPTGQDSHWVLPSVKEGEGYEDFFTALQQELFSPKSHIETIAGASKMLNTAAGKQPFQLVRITRGEINPQFDSERFFDARWASFEEAFHISSGHNETVLRWAERLSKKSLAKPLKSSVPALVDKGSVAGGNSFMPAGAALA